MSDWREATLGDVCELKRGYDLPRGSRANGSVPVISSSGSTGWHNEAKVQAPGVVTGRYGTLGQVFYVTEDFWPLNTSLYVRDFKGNDPQFIAALLRSLDLSKYDGAAAVPGLNRNHLHTLPVRVPGIAVQQTIARVAQAFDDLIANNQRRVEVLEEIARATYREWFVRFRYPGHEGVPLVDSALGPIPEGWDIQPFDEIASFVNGFAFKPSHWGADGRPIIKIKELKAGITADTPRCREDAIDKKYWVEGGDLLMSWSADLGAYLWVDEPGLLNQHLFLVRPTNDSVASLYLLHALDNAMPEFQARAQGTTMRHIKRAALHEVATRIPPPMLVARFDEVVKPIHWESMNVQAQTRGLSAMRDLLLPKVVTGEIDLSSLNLDELFEDAVV